MYNSLNIPKSTGLYTLKGSILWRTKHVSLKLLLREKARKITRVGDIAVNLLDNTLGEQELMFPCLICKMGLFDNQMSS